MTYFWIGVGAPWDGQRAHSITTEKESVANDDSCGCVRYVSELKARSDIPRGEDLPISRAHPVVDSDAVYFVVLDAGRFEPEPGDVGYAACAHEYLVHDEFHLLAALINSQHFLVS